MGIMKPAAWILLPALTAIAGCGVFVTRPQNFPDAIVGADGRVIVLEEIQAIVDDEELNSDEKRQQIEDLGIEDPALIDVLLTL